MARDVNYFKFIVTIKMWCIMADEERPALCMKTSTVAMACFDAFNFSEKQGLLSLFAVWFYNVIPYIVGSSRNLQVQDGITVGVRGVSQWESKESLDIGGDKSNLRLSDYE